MWTDGATGYEMTRQIVDMTRSTWIAHAPTGGRIPHVRVCDVTNVINYTSQFLTSDHVVCMVTDVNQTGLVGHGDGVIN